VKHLLILVSLCEGYTVRKPFDQTVLLVITGKFGQRAYVPYSLLTTNLVGDLRSPDKFGT